MSASSFNYLNSLSVTKIFRQYHEASNILGPRQPIPSNILFRTIKEILITSPDTDKYSVLQDAVLIYSFLNKGVAATWEL